MLQFVYSHKPTSADINNAYTWLFHDGDGPATIEASSVFVTTQKWRGMTFTASVLKWKCGAAGGGQPTPGMLGLAGARHPARMATNIPGVRRLVTRAAGTSGMTADNNYMLVPWPELCDADARACLAAEGGVASAGVGASASASKKRKAKKGSRSKTAKKSKKGRSGSKKKDKGKGRAATVLVTPSQGPAKGAHSTLRKAMRKNRAGSSSV